MCYLHLVTKLKVVVTIFEQLIPITGGGTPRIRSIIDSLIRKGHQVTVAATFATNHKETLDILNCDETIPLKGVDRLDTNKMKKYLLSHPINIQKVVQGALKQKPDLIIAHNSIAGLAGLLAKKVTKSLVVMDMTDFIFEYISSFNKHAWGSILETVGNNLENYVIKGSDRIITVSKAMKQILSQKGANYDHVDVVYDGVNTELFHQFDSDAKKLRHEHASGFENVIMHHGVIDPQDQPEILVDSAVSVIKENPSTIFWVIGDGAAIPQIKQKAKKKGLSDHFFFSGWIPFEDVPRFISACDMGLVILPDISSARIRVTLKGFEYWACGKPIIVSDLPALREIVTSEENGLFYNPSDPNDLAKKISTLLREKSLSEKMGLNGRNLVKERYSWTKLADQFISICEKI